MKHFIVGLILSAFSVSSVSETEPFYLPYQLTKEDKNQIECLAKVIYHESRGESHKGQTAVALVTMNRTKSDKFPDNVCSVVYQKNKTTCQYSWHCTKTKIADSKLFQRSKSLAEYIYLNHDHIHDVTKGALFFKVADNLKKWNNLHPTVKIGSHVFYKIGVV